MRPFLCLAAILSSAAHAFASGGLSCTAQDDKAKLAIEIGVTRGMGSPVFNVRGEAEISDESMADDLRKTIFDGAHLAQYWLDDRNLNLRFYREREGDKPHGYVEIAILTQPDDDEGLYGGTYELTAFDMTGDVSGEGKTLTIGGRVSCFVE